MGYIELRLWLVGERLRFEIFTVERWGRPHVESFLNYVN